MKRQKALALGTALSIMLTLSACTSVQEEQEAARVITALPTEVQGCTFLCDLDTAPRITMSSARFELKRMAALLGATHVVETLNYPQRLNRMTWDVGVALSGRAYLCPEGLGPKVNNPQGELKMPEFMPHPSLNSDQPLFN